MRNTQKTPRGRTLLALPALLLLAGAASAHASAPTAHEGAGPNAQTVSAEPAEQAGAGRIRGSAHVSLRRGVSADPEGGITLDEIARITGDAADAVGRIVIVDDPEPLAGDAAYLVIDIELVRERLRAAGVRPSQAGISGGRCVVRFGKRVATPERAAEPVRADEHTLLASEIERTTVRGEIARQLAESLGTDPERLRLNFENRDDQTLRTTLTGRRVLVRRATSAEAARVVFDVLTFNDDGGLEGRARVRTDLSVLLTVRTAARRIERGETITESLFDRVESWQTPGRQAPLAHTQPIDGWLATERIDIGEVLSADQAEPPVLIQRGELVRVFAHSGGFTVELTARALEDGGKGDRIAVKIDDSESPFTVTVDGSKRAVTTLD